MTKVFSGKRKFFRRALFIRIILHQGKRNLTLIILLMTTGLLVSCSKPSDIRDAILNHKNNFYHIDFGKYPEHDASLPVGVFDSGTGGLSVLADIVNHEGLENESYIYLGDLANMPYGNYAQEINTGLLIEHVMKDVQYLLGYKYYR